MLRTTRLVAATVLAAGIGLCGPIVAAQGVVPVSFGVSGGVSVPESDLADGSGEFTGVKTGYNITGSVGLGLPVLPFSLRGDVAYNSFDSKNVQLPATSPNPSFNADARILGFTANVVFPIHLPVPVVRPYLIGGAGVYNVRFSPTTGSSSSQSNFGFNIGAGVSVPFVLVDGFIEARYHHVNQDNGTLAFVPITVGVMF